MNTFRLTLLAGCFSVCVGCGGNNAPPLPRPSTPPAVTPAATPASPAVPADTPSNLHSLQVRIRYAAEKAAVGFESPVPVLLQGNGQSVTLPAGKWRVAVSAVQPAQQRFHVFPKTFEAHQTAELQAYLKAWTQQGYSPTIEIFGRQLQTSNGRMIDNRQFWVSLAQFPSAAQAESLIARLKQDKVWAWMRPEKVADGTATLQFMDAANQQKAALAAPVTMETAGLLHLANVDSGFWQESRADRSYASPLKLEIGPQGTLEVFGQLPVEQYLQGVLPAEMPASWPKESLKAQAVAARSEVLAAAGGKHRLEGFDFCALEHCRAFRGESGHMPTTDAALAETNGVVLVAGNRTVPTVFSANCGGWTENNEVVWSGPVNPALRGIADMAGDAKPPATVGLAQWLAAKPAAYCSTDVANYRWSKRLTVAEVSAAVNKEHEVGLVKTIETLDRGISGRLKAVRVSGTGGTATISRELPIRLAFGGLPSAVFIVEPVPGGFVFRGAGRGHGVGLCQQGARGMAQAGRLYDAILRHYFTGATLERLE